MFNVPFMNSQDVETLCCCVLEFDDVAAPQHLSLTTGPLKFHSSYNVLEPQSVINGVC